MSDLSRVEQLLRNALGEDIYEVTPQSRVEALLVELNELIEGMGGSVSPEAIATAVAAYLDEHLTNPTSPPVDTSLAIAGAAADAQKTGSEISELKSGLSALKEDDAFLVNTSVYRNVLNRFNKAAVREGKYIDVTNGNLKDNSSFFASDYIYIGDLTSVNISYTHLFGWYDADKNWLGHPDIMSTNPADRTYTVPEGAIYLRFSNYNYNLNLSQIGADVSRDNYIPYGLFTIPDYYEGLKPVIVDASGNGDYTSFTQAIYKTKNSGRDVIVRAGTYDIKAEYVALFGQTAIDEMSDSSDMNGFQRGISLDNRKITFESGAHLVCDWSDYTVNGTHRFCALDIGVNVELVGLDLDCTGTWYCIHDDRGTNDYAYTNKYENCRVIGHALKNGQCIGGGCKKYSRHIINNCYLNNNSTAQGTLRYHNTNLADAEPEVYVSNTYIKTTFTPRYYGTQTTKMRVYVNNCEAVSIHKTAESSSFTTDNVELYKWCCTETSPVT